MAQAPFQALVNLAKQCQKAAQELPAKIESAPRWSGLGFLLMGQRFIAPLGQVAEILEVPGHTRLPGVQPWVIGLSNVRGRLLPLIDLPMFLGAQLGLQRRNHRVLVFDSGDIFSGLMIERSLGMQHFELGQHSAEQDEQVPDLIKSYLEGSYVDAQEQRWNVIDLNKLAADARFANASLL
ncbi:chemotaxis protein CheW [Agaribacterium haliotis]|uniref:chemotaxis protein CheW n=1 Tax=Agaribacterium haliotis TaxID=2013869 RepID=UPI000BB581A9|nr:chemotaxis protein CheW [Agaribacterium haliotis]